MFQSLSIHNKLTLALGGVAVLAFVLVGTAVLLFEFFTMDQRAQQAMQPYAQLISVGVEVAVSFEDAVRAQEILDTVRANPQIESAEVVLGDGRVLARYRSTDPSRPLLRTTPGRNTAELREELAEGAHLQLVMSLDELDRQARNSVLLFCGGLLVLLAAITLGLRIALQRSIIQPIATLAETVEQVRRRTDYHQRVPAAGVDEVARLGRSFNAMMTVIEERASERKRAEDALRLSSERLNLAARVARVGIWDWDVVKNELLWEDSMYQLYGIQAEDFGGAYDAWVRTIHPEDRALTEGEIQAALRGEHEYAPEFRIVLPDGAIRHIKAVSKTFRDREGNPIRMIGTNIDITEHKQAEIKIRMLNQELEQRVKERTARLEAVIKELQGFAYTIAHDLRAPLRHLDGFVELLVSRCREELSEQARHYVDTIGLSARKMGMLIDDLLAFSRISRAEMKWETVNMNRMVQEVLASLKMSCAGRSIDWSIGDLPAVQGDPVLLHRIWANLLENAVKYTQVREAARIEIGSREENGERVFFVADNGVGFDMQYVHKIFGVFQRLHSEGEFEGTGIGLATVHRIITRHGGRIWAEAKLDQGAAFYFTLPKHQSTP